MCTHCGRLIYLDERPPHVWRHYFTSSQTGPVSDTEFCYPDLAGTDAFSTFVATPERTP